MRGSKSLFYFLISDFSNYDPIFVEQMIDPEIPPKGSNCYCSVSKFMRVLALLIDHSERKLPLTKKENKKQNTIRSSEKELIQSSIYLYFKHKNANKNQISFCSKVVVQAYKDDLQPYE